MGMYKFTYKTEDGLKSVFIKGQDIETALAIYKENYNERVILISEESGVEFIS